GEKRLRLAALGEDQGLPLRADLGEAGKGGVEPLEQSLGLAVAGDLVGAGDQRVELGQFVGKQPPLDRQRGGVEVALSIKLLDERLEVNVLVLAERIDQII